MELFRVSVVATGIEVENQIVENSNDLGVTSKALVRENSRSIMDNRYTSTPSQKSADLGELETNISRSTNLILIMIMKKLIQLKLKEQDLMRK